MSGGGQSLAGTTWDAIVIGAGPAGALAARLLAAAGASVLLVEKKRFPRPKVCGACLNGRALAVLAASGLGGLVARLGAVELNHFQLQSAGRSLRIALSAGAAVSRSSFDTALVESAVERGARFVSETRATVIAARGGFRWVALSQGGSTTEVPARVVLAAAGLGNPCRDRQSTGSRPIAAGSRMGAGCRIEDRPDFLDAHTIFMAVGEGGYVGMVRVEDGSVNVAAAFDPALVRRFASPGRAASFIVAGAGFPSIPALEETHWSGTPPFARRADPLADERLFVLGDAAGYIEPITGEGMAWALAGAHAVVPIALEAIECWNPDLTRAWSSTHRRLIADRQILCRLSALTLRKPWLTRLAIEIITRAPAAGGLILNHLNAPFSHSSKAS